MAWGRGATLVVLVVALCLSALGADAHLKVGYYSYSCPAAELIVKEEVEKALIDDPGVGADLLRMHFHDCFVRGCDGSVLIDSTEDNTAEKDAHINLTLEGFEIIDAIKEKLEAACKGVVSCADVLAFAARDSVVHYGGIHYKVPAGRRDGTVSKEGDTSILPSPALDLTELTKLFISKGLSQNDMITLSGAHTVGIAHCDAFTDRLYNTDETLDWKYAAALRKQCPPGSNNTVSMDPKSPQRFDNHYYRSVLRKRGLFASDQTLLSTQGTTTQVKRLASNYKRFERKFAAAIVKMGQIGILTGSEGEGCDGSLLIDSTKDNAAEKDGKPNETVEDEGFEIIDKIKERLEAECKGTVSCADILAFLARDSVAHYGGVHYPVPAGRRDGRISRANDTLDLPPPTFKLGNLTKLFVSKGLSRDDMVALSGAHTIGIAHCSAFSDRLYNFSQMVKADPSLHPTYAAQLRGECPTGSDNEVDMDPPSPLTFDNSYFKSLLVNRGLFTSDQTLMSKHGTATLVKRFAKKPALFKKKFAAAMVKMGSIGVLTGEQGEIRTNCRVSGWGGMALRSGATPLAIVVALCLIAATRTEAQLRVGFYSRVCPKAELIVKQEVEKAARANPGIAAGLLRLHFHVCFVRGCDGSVLIDSTWRSTAEKDAPPNKSLRGFEVIDRAKRRLEALCRGKVPCADILAFAARDSLHM
ncbi:peroxidase [Musa troglodytarum]|uniref:Peroxidase 1 n=1 Tax=Musa troglodytarum TaxID=320322 RepID=A0A9E7HMT5_9LILI|nr:peroxidase [Musa troglodytarum]URE37421.1 peroxidase [Musa troglodytarum]